MARRAGLRPDFALGFSDIFDDIFGDIMAGGRGRRSAAASAAPICATTSEITLEEAYAGKTAQVRVPTSVTCEVCSGSGAKPGTQPEDLPDLQRRRPRARQPGLLLHRAHLPDLPRPRPDRSPTPARNAPARAASPRSARCRSTSPPASRTARASGLPARARPALRGGPPGDLYIFLSVKPHEFFQRDGADSTAACRSR